MVKPSSGSARDIHNTDFIALFFLVSPGNTGSSKVTVDNKLKQAHRDVIGVKKRRKKIH